MGRAEKGNGITTLFIILLCFLFSFSVLAVLMQGVNVYRGISAQSESIYGDRVSLAYIAAKIRHADRSGAVSVEKFGDGEALVLSEYHFGVEYVTMIYKWKDSIYELFAERELGLPPESGVYIADIRTLAFSIGEDGLIEITCDSGNGEERLVISLRSSGGDGVWV